MFNLGGDNRNFFTEEQFIFYELFLLNSELVRIFNSLNTASITKQSSQSSLSQNKKQENQQILLFGALEDSQENLLFQSLAQREISPTFQLLEKVVFFMKASITRIQQQSTRQIVQKKFKTIEKFLLKFRQRKKSLNIIKDNLINIKILEAMNKESDCIACCQHSRGDKKNFLLTHTIYPIEVLYLSEEQAIENSQKLLSYCCALQNTFYGGIIIIGFQQIQKKESNETGEEFGGIPSKKRVKNDDEKIQDIIDNKIYLQRQIHHKLKKIKEKIKISIIDVGDIQSSQFVIRLHVEPTQTLSYIFNEGESCRRVQRIYTIQKGQVKRVQLEKIYEFLLNYHKNIQNKRKYRKLVLEQKSCKKEVIEFKEKIRKISEEQAENGALFIYQNQALLIYQEEIDKKEKLMGILNECQIKYNTFQPFPRMRISDQIKLLVVSHEEPVEYLKSKFKNLQTVRIFPIKKKLQWTMQNYERTLKDVEQVIWREFSFRIQYQRGPNKIEKQKTTVCIKFQNIFQSLYCFMYLYNMHLRPQFVTSPQLFNFYESN